MDEQQDDETSSESRPPSPFAGEAAEGDHDVQMMWIKVGDDKAVEVINKIRTLSTKQVFTHYSCPRVFKGTRFARTPLPEGVAQQLMHMGGTKLRAALGALFEKYKYPGADDEQFMQQAINGSAGVANSVVEKFCLPRPSQLTDNQEVLRQYQPHRAPTAEEAYAIAALLPVTEREALEAEVTRYRDEMNALGDEEKH
ncbi:hypothetical protein CLAFUW4_06059 [Fulvia fulva]|uniref:Uncharacterized protein n=1 Tax=Passalora fulva TaxID=5499 RepID=A0A9Q8P9C8_PASFU|nr:uncharacterized protein CLAFUR5_06203 [Fulvia fulva]KAK4624373.1 hypothetical protein CLAFUR4_06063 [Fulvia fulva]KAK4624973.1 hypothetical protein CLAFUR0_06067 [Fulvia fulva]UJO18028.1 hypothetical protein CLAFUR5_06203 [Fulvia fulva]WPV14472.1 hypothetical protein CLAFUW4_06059 [Fulvia fulva]WPV30468.1 hypothetical protein CLAFUW7_06056 [Fulvia fulva]